MRRLITFLLEFLLALALLWAVGLTWFLSEIPAAPADDGASTDAIVVLTGGGKRLEHGFDVFRAGRAKAMLISGVGEGVTLGDLIAGQDGTRPASGLPASQLAAISLGYAADSTATNATETRAWMERHGFKSLRLVTASYHMPRSLLELSALMPDVVIAADPVFPDDFTLEGWWRHAGSRKLVLLEYHKFLAAWLRLHDPRSSS